MDSHWNKEEQEWVGEGLCIHKGRLPEALGQPVIDPGISQGGGE